MVVLHKDSISLRRRLKKSCSVRTIKKRLPIVEWLPKYNITTLIQDIIAGITVGLTAIPQGIAYAVVAGLSPEYGLYAGLLGGFVYLFFGSCKDITIGPTAVLSTMTAKYVAEYSSDFAVLAAFLSGLVQFAMGVLHLGFIVKFISQTVITGFTNAAALQIASSQLKALLGLDGSSGHVFYDSMVNFIKHIKTIQLWDSVLGIITIILLFLLKRLGKGCSRTDGFTKRIKWFISLGRNAVVVILGIIIAYSLKVAKGTEPFTLIGDIGKGLPSFRPPPFSTTVGNETYTFTDMMRVLGPQSVILPLVSILESVAIAKAFAGSKPVDATQEMMALGLCNIAGSFVRSMPVTGSFTRTAINNASGVQTPAGGIFTGLLILLALSLLTSTFYYIPKATLAGLIITAMFCMMECTIFIRLWKNSKKELIVLTTTIIVSLILGLEYGIVTGVSLEAVMLLYGNSKPYVTVSSVNNQKTNVVIVSLLDSLAYCAGEYVRRTILKASIKLSTSLIIIDGTNLTNVDTTVASNLMSVVKDLEKRSVNVLFFNFNTTLKNICLSVSSKNEDKFVYAPSISELLINISNEIDTLGKINEENLL